MEQDVTSALKARCGAVLPVVAIGHDQPPPGPPYESCARVFIADHSAMH